MYDNNLPIEYLGIEESDYEFPTTMELIYTYNEEINIKSIIKAYIDIELAVQENIVEYNRHNISLATSTLNIEYIDYAKDEAISILSNNFYLSLKYDDTVDIDFIKPKAIELQIKKINNNSLYFYLQVSPC